MRSVDDLTTRARIREAALARFPQDGYAGTTIRAIAADAGVSPALVVHHFGSKEGLHRECDEYVVRALGASKREALDAGTHRDPGSIAAAYRMVEPLLRYLAWTLTTGGETAARIFDDLLDDVTAQLIEGRARGIVSPVDDPRSQAALLVVMQLGGLVLHEHLSRALGVNTLTSEGLVAMAPHALKIFSGELFDRQMMQEASRAIDELRRNPDPQEEAS